MDGLFNFQDPRMLQEQYLAQQRQNAMAASQLPLLQQVVASGGNLGASLGTNLGRMFGGRTSAEVENETIKGIFAGAAQQSADPVERLQIAAEEFRKRGMEDRAIALEQEAAKMGAQVATARQAEASMMQEQEGIQLRFRGLKARVPDITDDEAMAIAQDPAAFREVMKSRKPIKAEVGGRVKLFTEEGQEIADLGSAMDRRSVQNVQVGSGRVGTIPPGFELIEGPDGRLSMVPIAGGPADIAAREAEEAAAKGSEVVRTAAQTVFEDANRAIDVLDRFGGFAAGVGGITAPIPATPAKELDGHIFSMKGNIGIDQLLKIKASGAGLGQIPQTQLEMLGAMLGNLDVRQNPRVLRENIKRIEEIYADIVRKEGGDPIALAQQRGFPVEGESRRQQPPGAGQAPTMRWNPNTGRLEPIRN